MRATNLIGLSLIALLVAGCGEQPATTGPQPSLDLVPVPAGPNPLGEEIVVCKAGGEGTYSFTFTGGASGSFDLQPGECWNLGFFGGAGVSLTITETPRAGHEVVSIAVDQLSSADQFVTGTNSVTGVKGSGAPKDAALVTFTNRVLPPGDEGCTLGYWKNHAGFGPQANSWPPSGYAPTDLFSSVFTGYSSNWTSLTLHGALGLGGGSGVAGAERILAKQAVAALLNAAHPGVNYYTSDVAALVSQVNAAFASQNRDTMVALAGTLDGYNNAGCPLN